MDFSRAELGDYITMNTGYKGSSEKYLIVHYFKGKLYYMSLQNTFLNDLFYVKVPEGIKMKIKESEFSPTGGIFPMYKGGSDEPSKSMTLQKKVKDPTKDEKIPLNEAIGLGYEYAVKVEYNQKYNNKKVCGICKIHDGKSDRRRTRGDFNSYTGTQTLFYLLNPKFQSKKNLGVFEGDIDKARKKGFRYSFYYNEKQAGLESAEDRYKREVLDTWEDEEYGEVLIFKDWEKYQTKIVLQ